MPTFDEFFSSHDDSRQIYEAVRRVIESIGAVEVRVSKSQIAFRRCKAFAWVWMPELYLHRKAAPLVLSLAFRFRDDSPRWKEIVEPYPGRFMHHLELWSVEEIDEQVRAWLNAAWEAAG